MKRTRTHGVERSQTLLRKVALVSVALASGFVGITGCVGTGTRGRGVSPSRSAIPDLGRPGRASVSPFEAQSLEDLASGITSRSRRAIRYLDAADAWLGADRPRESLRCAAQVRSRQLGTALEHRLWSILGEAHLRLGELQLADRYLRKSLARAKGAERDHKLALLATAARARGERQQAAHWERQIFNPNSATVRATLSFVPPSSTPVPLAKSSRVDLHRESRRVHVEPLSAYPTVRTQRSAAQAMRHAIRLRQETARLQSTPPATPVKRGQKRPDAATGARPSRMQGTMASLRALPRATWGAQPVRRRNTKPMGRVDKITVHHSAPPADFTGGTQGLAGTEIRKIQRHHQRNKGWADIGYHYVIDRNGRLWQGRSLEFQGAHASGKANRGNIGIVLLGNYSPGRQHMTQAQGQCLTTLLAQLTDYFKLSPDAIYTHNQIRSAGHTACPGPEITAYVARVRQALEHRLIARRSAGTRGPLARTGYRGG